MKHLKTFTMAVLLAFPLSGLAAETSATLYKNPNCGCCAEYAKYLERSGLSYCQFWWMAVRPHSCLTDRLPAPRPGT